MDPFHPIRLSARHLHQEIETGKLGSRRAIDLVIAAVEHEDLELVWVAKTNVALKGANALFDEQSGTICCADEGNNATRAVLVAHELGHACLHNTAALCQPDEIDASAPAEATPVGLQSVEDYGIRERKELQANVFAREFLLPYSLVQKLHVENRLGASEIAKRLELPLSMVRQQILDTLLLPQVAVPAPVPTLTGARIGDLSQRAAAEHHEGPFLLQAGPGTGKTRTLVERVVHLVQQRVDPDTLLVLTFSNRAAGELTERIASAVPAQSSRIWIGTFHAFGLELIRKYHDRLALQSDPQLLDRSDAIELLQETLPTLPLVHYRNLWDPSLILRDALAAISRAKDELVDRSRYRELGDAMLDLAHDEPSRKAAEQALEVGTIYDQYQELLESHGAMDFGDLIMRPALLLESDPAVQQAVRRKHRHILVDEYQDVNHASARLLKTLAGDGERLWVVGDARQSIYRFRGASSRNMSEFGRDYPNTTTVQLSTNYRSCSEINDTIVAIAGRMQASNAMLPLTTTAQRGCSGNVPEVASFKTPAEEAAGIASSIRELAAKGVSYREQAVLCRTNRRLDELAAVVEATGIPVLHLGSLFERDEIRDLLALMSLVVDSTGTGLARVGAMPRYDIPTQDISTIVHALVDTKGPAAFSLPTLLNSLGLSVDGERGLERLVADLTTVTERSTPWDFLAAYLLDRTEYIAELASCEGVPSRMRAIAIWQFLNFVRQKEDVRAGVPIRNLLGRVRQLVLLAEERDLRRVPAAAFDIDAVRFLTVHGSKGLEFEAVHIPSMTVASFPANNRGDRCPPPDGMRHGSGSQQEHLTEEECLFFVATSRARNHLSLYHPRTQPNGKRRSRSPFVDWISDVTRDSSLRVEPVVESMPPRIVIEGPDRWQISDSSLRLYEICPQRFFYTHVVGLRAQREKTAFTRTHDCIYELMRWRKQRLQTGSVDRQSVTEEFGRIWRTSGPTSHSLSSAYRSLADDLVKSFLRLSTGTPLPGATDLTLEFANGKIVVTPDEIVTAPDGSVVLRRIRTGSKRSAEYDRIEYTLYHLAGRAHYSDAYSVEAVHLADDVSDDVSITAKKMENRRLRGEKVLQSVRTGQFQPTPDPVRCPRCPHFFVCNAATRGPLPIRAP